MMQPLACFPSIGDSEGIKVALWIYLLIKPLTYFLFIQAFRYRVSRPIPMTSAQAGKLALLRAAIGLLVVGGGTVLMLGVPGLRFISWIYAYCARLWAWWFVGSRYADLVGHRLAAWTLFGTLINVAFDLAFVGGALAGPGVPLMVTGGIGVFIAVLSIIGRRGALKMRFVDAPNCMQCGYDLTGNLSGVCPECGTALVMSDFEGDAVALPGK